MPKFGDSRFDLDNLAQSCLHKAVTKGHSKLMRYLIEEGGFDPSLREKVIKYTCTLAQFTLTPMYLYVQNDLDCFLLACYRGQLRVVQELVNRHKMDPHVVNEVRVGVLYVSNYC